MEQDWARQKTTVPITLATALALLSRRGFEPVSLHPLAEGKANTNVYLELTDGQSVVLRLYQREKAAQLLEIALLRQFRGTVPVAEVLAHDQKAAWTLLSFLPGETLQQSAAHAPEAEILNSARDIGQALASISAIRFDQPGFLTPALTISEAWPSVIDGLSGYLEICLSRPILTDRVGEDLPRSVSRAWTEALPALEDLTKQPNLSHADFKPSNLLIHQGRLSGVLDWEFAHSGTWLMDAGQVLRHRGELPSGFPDEFEAGFRAGGGNVPADWRRWAAIVDLMSLVDFLVRDECSPETVRHIGRLIHGTLTSVRQRPTS